MKSLMTGAVLWFLTTLEVALAGWAAYAVTVAHGWAAVLYAVSFVVASVAVLIVFWAAGDAVKR
jgi:hypothetical protein